MHLERGLSQFVISPVIVFTEHGMVFLGTNVHDPLVLTRSHITYGSMLHSQ